MKVLVCWISCFTLACILLGCPVPASADPISSVIANPVSDVLPRVPNPGSFNRHVASSEPSVVSLPQSNQAAPSVPEPWNYVSVVATVIPVGLLYFGLRRSRKGKGIGLSTRPT